MLAKPPNPFKVHLEDPPAVNPADQLLAGVLGMGEISALVAPPFAGKSLLAVTLAGCVASGRPFLGRRVSHGAVLYVAGERAQSVFLRRRAFGLEHGVTDLPLGIVVEPMIDLCHEQSDADRLADTARALEDQTGLPTNLIILDTLNAVFGGGDENAPKDMGSFLRNCYRLRKATEPAHVLVVHHAPKGNPTELRGHSALAGMVDLKMAVTAKGDRRSWTVIEANSLERLPSPTPFQMKSVQVGKYRDGAPISAPVLIAADAYSPDARASAVLRHLSDAGGWTSMPALVRSLSGNEAFGELQGNSLRIAVERIVQQLVERQEAEIDGSGKQRRVRATPHA